MVVLGASRWAYHAHPTPVHGDETELIAAIGFRRPHPVHPPGAPLWTAAGTLLRTAGLPAYAAYQAWSMLASVAAPLALFFGLRREVGDVPAGWTALAFGFNPLIWFLGETALPYSAACAAVVAVALLCCRALRDRRPAAFSAASAVLAASLLLRIDLLAWLGPLWGYVAWKTRGRHALAGFLMVLIGAATSMGVSAALYAGAAHTSNAPRFAHTVDVLLNTSVFRVGLVDGLIRSAVKLTAFFGWCLGLPALWVLLGTGLARRRDSIGPRPDKPLGILMALWVMPLLLFLLGVHMSESSHVLLVPAAYYLLAVWTRRRVPPRIAAGLMAGAATASLLQFVLYPWSADSQSFKRSVDAKVAYVSGQGLHGIDRRAEIHAPGDTWPTASSSPPPTLPPSQNAARGEGGASSSAPSEAPL